MQEHTNQIEPRPGDIYNMPGTKGVKIKEVNKSSSKTSIDGKALYYITYYYNYGKNKGIQKINVEAHRKEIESPKLD